MWDALSAVTPWLWYAVLLCVIVAGLFLNIVGLPGLWLIVVGVVLYAWWFGFALIGWWTIAIIVALGLLAELVEFAAGAAGSKAAGGTKRGMAGAIVGGLVGGLVGTALLPIPIVGTIVGSVLGTFVGSYVIELGINREHGDAMWISYGAAKGRVWGMVFKSVFGVAMGILAAIMGLPLSSRQPTPTVPATTMPVVAPASNVVA